MSDRVEECSNSKDIIYYPSSYDIINSLQNTEKVDDFINKIEEAVYTWDLEAMKIEWCNRWGELPKGKKPWFLDWRFGIPTIDNACKKCGLLNKYHNCKKNE